MSITKSQGAENSTHLGIEGADSFYFSMIMSDVNENSRDSGESYENGVLFLGSLVGTGCARRGVCNLHIPIQSNYR